jgi:hypothetical protein
MIKLLHFNAIIIKSYAHNYIYMIVILSHIDYCFTISNESAPKNPCFGWQRALNANWIDSEQIQ